MIVNSINAYRPFIGKAKVNTANTVPSPTFTGNEKAPHAPHKASVLGKLKMLIFGGAMLTAVGCSGGEGSNIKPPIDASTLIAIDTSVPMAIDTNNTDIDTGTDMPKTTKELLLQKLQDAGLVPKDAIELPNKMEHILLVGNEGYETYNSVEELNPTKTNFDVVVYNGLESCSGGYNGDCEDPADYFGEPKQYTVTYESKNEIITKTMQFDNQTFNFEMTSNGLFETMEVSNLTIGCKKIAPETAGCFLVNNLETPIFTTEWKNDGIPIATRIRKGTKALAKKFGKATHDLKTGEISVPIGKGKLAVIKDLAETAVKRARI